jgi:hypothetical protein
MSEQRIYRQDIIVRIRNAGTPDVRARMIQRIRRFIEERTGAQCLDLYPFMETGDPVVLQDIAAVLRGGGFTDDNPISDIPSDPKTK